MSSKRTQTLLLPFLLLSFIGAGMPEAWSQQNGNVARLVVWQAKPGMSRDLDEGYKRHLEWHRKNGDVWTWHGWTMLLGDRPGYFVDGTFSHAWADFDSPVSPAADAADVGINVLPYGEVRAAADYELIPGLTDLDPQQLTSPLLTFWYFAVRPGAAAEFESLITSELKNPHGTAVPHALLRPANGSTEYLLLLPAAKASDTATHAQFVGRLLKASVRDMKGTPLVDHYRTETGRYRSDLSYTPNTNATMGKP